MSKLNQLFVLRNVVLDNWRDDKQYFLGKVLTVIDASISDKEQRKGLKDLIKDAYYEKNYREEDVRQDILDFAKVHSPQLISNNFSEDDFIGRIGQGKPICGQRGNEPEPLFHKE